MKTGPLKPPPPADSNRGFLTAVVTLVLLITASIVLEAWVGQGMDPDEALRVRVFTLINLILGAGLAVALRALQTQRLRRSLAEAQIAEHVDRFRRAADATPALIWSTDRLGRCDFLNRAWLDLTGVAPAANVTPDWLAAVHDADKQAARLAFSHALAAGEEFSAEYRLRAKDGDYRTLLARARPLRGPTSEFLGYVCVSADITDERRTHERLRESLETNTRLLAREESLRRELNHRVRNNLAGLLGLVGVYQRTMRDSSEFAAAIRGKVLAMNAVHNLLSKADGLPPSLGTVVRTLWDHLAPDRRGSLSMEGPEGAALSPERAAAFAMIVQELLTNSAKYGSLSTPGGAVRVHWHRGQAGDQPALTFEWTESGGPAIRNPAPRENVGLGLIKGLSASELAGRASFEFAPTGLRCTITIGEESTIEHAPARTASHTSGAHA